MIYDVRLIPLYSLLDDVVGLLYCLFLHNVSHSALSCVTLNIMSFVLSSVPEKNLSP